MLRARRSRHGAPYALVALATALVGLNAPSVLAGGEPVLPVDHAATAGARAVSLGAEQVGPLPTLPAVDSPALAGCDAAVLQRLVASDPTSSQWVVVSTPTATSTTGELFIATVQADRWVCTLAATPAEVGRAGVRPLLQRRSGDDTTPAGVFPLGTVATPQGAISFFGNAATPGGVHGAYRRVQPGDCYGANPNTAGYGHWRVDPAGCTGDDELLERNVQAYEHAVLIGANTEPMVSGDTPGEIPYAAAIFLHRTTYSGTGAPKPTSGCVSIGHAALVTALRAIDPALRPRFAIGTRDDLLATPARTTLPTR
jgi:L,D-peptidoglycan transpeptidase YkuD (ErfK/YbiS/YcfS/YnhG family)